MKTAMKVFLGLFLTSTILFLGNSTEAQPAATAPAETTVTPSAVDNTIAPASQAKLKEAVEKFNKSDIKGSLESLKELVIMEPKMRPPRLIHAQWFAQLKNEKAFRMCLEVAANESPNDPESFLLLGEIALQRGELMAAQLLFQQTESVLANYTSNPERQKNIVKKLMQDKLVLYQARGDWDQMQIVLGQLRELEGDSAEICQKIALTFFQKNEESNARQWLQHAEGLAGDKAVPADVFMARFYLGRNDVAKAKESLAAAQVSNPKSAEVMTLAIVIALSENNVETAWKNAQSLTSTRPNDLGVWKTYGNVALYRSDFTAAEQAFQKVIKEAPADYEAVNGLALALCEQKDVEKKKLALQYAATNIQKQENNREFLSTYGWCLYQLGQKDQALKALQHAAADGRSSQANAYYLAVILAEKNQKDQAKNLLQTILKGKQSFAKRDTAAQLLESLK